MASTYTQLARLLLEQAPNVKLTAQQKNDIKTKLNITTTLNFSGSYHELTNRPLIRPYPNAPSSPHTYLLRRNSTRSLDWSTTEVWTNTEKSKLNTIQNGAQKSVQADWNENNPASSAYIKNKRTQQTQSLPQANWTQTNRNALDYIKNVPTPQKLGEQVWTDFPPNMPSQVLDSLRFKINLDPTSIATKAWSDPTKIPATVRTEISKSTVTTIGHTLIPQYDKITHLIRTGDTAVSLHVDNDSFLFTDTTTLALYQWNYTKNSWVPSILRYNANKAPVSTRVYNNKIYMLMGREIVVFPLTKNNGIYQISTEIKAEKLTLPTGYYATDFYITDATNVQISTYKNRGTLVDYAIDKITLTDATIRAANRLYGPINSSTHPGLPAPTQFVPLTNKTFVTMATHNMSIRSYDGNNIFTIPVSDKTIEHSTHHALTKHGDTIYAFYQNPGFIHKVVPFSYKKIRFLS